MLMLVVVGELIGVQKGGREKEGKGNRGRRKNRKKRKR